jgi:DNA-binding transcriptional MocR family regulator
MSTTVNTEIALKRGSAEALSRQLAAQIKAQIKRGGQAPGQRLGSVRDLARRHGLSTQTVADAYSQLVAAGLVVARRGAGYYVAEPRAGVPAGGGFRASEQLDPRRLRREVRPERQEVVRLGAGMSAEWQDQTEIDTVWRRHLRNALSTFSDYDGTRGYEPLRVAIAHALGTIGIQVPAANTLLTSGATQAIDLVVRLLVKPGDTVLVDDPGYFQTQWALKAQGARVLGVPRTPQGPDLDAFERLCQEAQPRLFFTQSALQNPTGSALSLATAHALLRSAERHGMLIVEDDVSGDLAPEHLPRLAMLDRLDRVIYVGSFSKTLTPSLRVGYLATNRTQLLEELTQIKLVSTFVSCAPNESLVHALMEGGHFARHVRRQRQRLQDRAHQVLPRLVRMGFEPDPAYPYLGGTFVWVRHRAHADALVLADQAAEAGILLAPGCAFRPDHQSSPHLRFALPLCTPTALDALAQLLAGQG